MLKQRKLVQLIRIVLSQFLYMYVTSLHYYMQGSRWRVKKSPCGCSLRFVLVPKEKWKSPCNFTDVLLLKQLKLQSDANFNCFNSKKSVYYYYKIFVFQTAIVKGHNRNSYEYKNCTTDPYSGK